MNEYKRICVHGHPRANEHGIVAEHIIVAEKKLGRPIKEEEAVHHIDGNKLNNSPDNLMVFATKAEHALFHHGGIAYKKGDVWICKRLRMKAICEHCGKVFYLPYGRKIRGSIYCRKECTYAARVKINSSIDDIVSDLYASNGNFSEVGRKYGVTPNAIVKLCKTHGLKYHSSDYKTKGNRR